MHPYFEPTGFRAFAHRGDHDAGPENTFVAFESAVKLGFQYLETDVHLSADGTLFAFHDDTLDRVTDQRGRINTLDAASVARARVLGATAGDHRIPTLAALFDAYPDTRFNIEPKSDSAVAPLVALIKSAAAVERVCIGSFSGRRIAAVRASLPGCCTSMGPLETTWARLQSLHIPTPRIAADCAQVPVRQWGIPIVDARFVESQREHGRETHVWTVNDEREMNRLLDLGVDGIMTDYPTRLKTLLKQRGLWH